MAKQSDNNVSKVEKDLKKDESAETSKDDETEIKDDLQEWIQDLINTLRKYKS